MEKKSPQKKNAFHMQTLVHALQDKLLAVCEHADAEKLKKQFENRLKV